LILRRNRRKAEGINFMMSYSIREHQIEKNEYKITCFVCHREIEEYSCLEYRCFQNSFVASFFICEGCSKSDYSFISEYHDLFKEIVHLKQDNIIFSNGKLVPLLKEIEANP
jgi:hypothetical protein